MVHKRPHEQARRQTHGDEACFTDHKFQLFIINMYVVIQIHGIRKSQKRNDTFDKRGNENPERKK